MSGEPVIERLASVGSTNAELAGRLAAQIGLQEGHWIVADRQTAGRGRLGRTWQDGEGNFMGSTVVFPTAVDPAPHTLALVAGIAVFDTVARAIGGRDGLQLKWPNDLLLGGAKLAGILLEKVGEGVIIGIGVNLATAPQIDGRKAVALTDKGVKTYRDIFAFHLAIELGRMVGIWRAEGLGRIIAEWIERGPRTGARIRATLSETEAAEGFYDGLNDDGSLRMRLEDGSLRAIHAGEVTLIDGE